MSQQSNPATLREALSEARKLVHDFFCPLLPMEDYERLVTDEKYSGTGSLIVTWGMKRKLEQVIAPALAASGLPAQAGTEAASVHMRCPKCGQDVFLHGETCPSAPSGDNQLIVRHADGTDHCVIDAPVISQPAAASPEGEGRKANLPTCNRCHMHVQTVGVDTGFAGESEQLCGKCVSYEYEQMESQIAALRQSAAPSGGATLIESWRKRTNTTEGSYVDGFADAMNECADELAAWLAQESKTGAVTETK